MKKKGKQVLVILFVSLILISSVSMVSAAWYSGFTNFFKDLFNIGEDSDLQGELASIASWEQDSLVAYYNLDNNAQDFVGNNHGQKVGNVYYNGEAAYFDGSGDYVEISDDDSLDLTGEMSFSVWVKPMFNHATVSSGKYVFSKRVGDGTAYFLKYQHSGSDFRFGLDTIESGFVFCDYTVNNWNIGDWHHLSGTYDGENMKIIGMEY